MITLGQGNILNADTQAVINTVNTKGIMGKGIALQFKKAYPDMFGAYAKACKEGKVAIGKMFVWENDTMFGPRLIVNFPTKDDWRRPSRLKYIQDGLYDLVDVIREHNITSIAIPPLGCGNGGLDWREVKPLLISALEKLPEVKAVLYEPSTRSIVGTRKRPPL
jgi:O-acetyl-ADP-ribose deacetylase (regulator of RNase III)